MDAVVARKFWGLGSAAVLGISVLLPWITVFGVSGALINAGDGQILIGAAVLAAVLVAVRPREISTRVVAVIAALFGLEEAIRIYIKIAQEKADAEGFGALMSPGFGLYLAGLAALSLAVWAVYTHVRKESAWY